MIRATLQITPLLDGSRRIAVACEHGTALGGDLRTAPLSEAAIIASIVQRHHQGWRCHCTRKLERQYPAALIPLDLRVVELLV